MKDKITKDKLKKYFDVTIEALRQAKSHVFSGKENYSQEIIDMVENYLSDAKHFEKQGDLVDAFAALNYAHGWIDAGVRLDIFDVHDNKLFTIR